MAYIIAKIFITASLIVLISEIAKRSDKLGALIAALPLVTIFTLIWLQLENQTEQKIANHAYYTFWYVLPTLPMFIAFPFLLPKFGFWPTMSISIFITVSCFVIFSYVIKQFGIELS